MRVTMRQKTRSAIAFIYAVLSYSNIMVYFGDDLNDIYPAIGYASILSLCIFSFLLQYSSGFGRERYRGIECGRRKFLWFLSIYFCSLLFAYSYSYQSELVDADFKSLLMQLFLVVLFLYVFNDKRTTIAGCRGVAFAVVLSVVVNYIDFAAGLIDENIFSTAPGRAAGLYVNPNIAGASLVLGMVVSMFVIPIKWRLPFCLLVGSAVIITFSRSSIVAFLLGFSMLVWYGIFDVNRRIMVLIIGAFALLLTSFQLGYIEIDDVGVSGVNLSQDALQRISYERGDKSVEGRLFSAEYAYYLFEKNPLVGQGIGYRRLDALINPHNQYLLIAVERGLIGLVVYIVLLVTVWMLRIPVARISATIIILLSFFSHNILDFDSRWLLFVLLIGLSGLYTHSMHNKV